MSFANIEDDTEKLRFKRLIQGLKDYRGTNTSMVTLFIKGNYQIPLVSSMIQEEKGKTSNIKDRQNANSVYDALTSAEERLRGIQKSPANGLCLFCGMTMQEDGKMKKISILLEPPKPIGTYYRCDKTFHLDELLNQTTDDKRFGFIIIDGNGALFGLVQGSKKEEIYSFTIELQSKTRRGGQSSVRFARLRQEQRHNYMVKVSETATRIFITDNKPNVEKLFLAGSADFKTDIERSDLMDPRLVRIIGGKYDVGYGGFNGFNMAIEQAKGVMESNKLTKEIEILSKFFEEINKNSNKIIFGFKETMNAYHDGMAEALIINENTNVVRVGIKTKGSSEIRYEIMEENKININTGEEIVEKNSLVDWLLENPLNGTIVYFITDRSSHGSQFVKGFGGFGAFVRFACNTQELYDDIVYDDEEFI